MAAPTSTRASFPPIASRRCPLARSIDPRAPWVSSADRHNVRAARTRAKPNQSLVPIRELGSTLSLSQYAPDDAFAPVAAIDPAPPKEPNPQFMYARLA